MNSKKTSSLSQSQKQRFEKIYPNGLELIIVPTNAPVVAAQVWVDVGSIDEKPHQAGYCHFLEHMLFKGTKKRTTSEIAGQIEGSGGEMNAFTSFEHTVYHITLSNEKWEVALDILEDMMFSSTFMNSEFKPEKEVILEEIKRGEDSSDRKLYQTIYSNLYGKEGYGRPVIGFPSTVSKCTASTLKSFWKTWYAAPLMTLVICGDVDVDTIEQKVAKTWGRRKSSKPMRRRRREIGFDVDFQSPKKKLGTGHFPMNSIRWVAAFPGCSIHDSAMPALDLAGSILGQGESSRLYQRIFKNEKLVTSIGCGVWTPQGEGMFTVDVESSVEQGIAFRKRVWEEIELFAKEGPTKEELDRAKTIIETDRIYSSQSMDGLANRVGFLKNGTGNADFDLKYISDCKNLTKEDIQNAVKRFLLAANPIEYVLAPKNQSLEELERESVKSNPNLAIHEPLKPIKKKETTTHEKISLPNGIELVMFPRQDIPIISFQSCTFGGIRTENRKNVGIGNIISEIWEKGPKGMSSEIFSNKMENKASRIDAFSGRNSLGMSCHTLTQFMDDVLPLYIDTLFNPALLQDEFKMAKVLSLEEIKTLADESSRLVGKMFCETLFDGHPYMFPLSGLKESVESLKHENVLAHFKSSVQESSLIVSVSGKFNIDRVVSAFEKVSRPNYRKSMPNALTYAKPKSDRIVEVKKNREQSHVVMGYSGLTVHDSDRYALKILSTVLGGQSGRLFTELRDKQGLCYTVAPISFEGLETGYFGVYMGFDPKKREQVLSGIQKELNKLVDKPIKNDELVRAKEFLTGRHHMDLQMNSAVASASAFNELYGLGYDEHLRTPEKLRRVTVKDVQKLARRLFNQPSVTALVV